MFYPVFDDEDMNIIKQDLLGNGSERQVYLGEIIGTKQKVAVKEFKQFLNKEQIECLHRIQDASFKYIIRIQEIILQPKQIQNINVVSGSQNHILNPFQLWNLHSAILKNTWKIKNFWNWRFIKNIKYSFR
ncbi:unnamed protein product [Paramecium sonneborni]|uniref:Protein kinase domain-containing protein n=1 Tax=Paramecium sonneborni TaxID=65129 RepID=A0A8S1MYF0_9CILI|nr:unnamed protein product [Paramecium sonneborni]